MLVGYLMSFEAIISRAILSYEIAGNEAYLAFPEKAPLAMGHIVVIPKEKPESVFDMVDRALSGFDIFAILYGFGFNPLRATE